MYAIKSYWRPASLAEATAILSREPGARVLAGGTDLLVAAREKGLPLETVVDLKAIPGLAGVSILAAHPAAPGGVPGQERLRVGALTTIHEIESSPYLRRTFPLLAEAAAMLGTRQIRNRATVGGNVANASPAAETACPLLAADAVAHIASPGDDSGTGREVPLSSFFVGPGRTVLRPGEVLTAVECPAFPTLGQRPGSRRRGQSGGLAFGSAYIKLGPRRAVDIAVVNVAALVGLDGDGRVAQARIALGSVAPTAFRALEAEAVLSGGEPTEAIINTAARAAQAAARPIGDVRASAWYRSEMVEELVTRGIMTALGRSAR